jgi:hypothetical protein
MPTWHGPQPNDQTGGVQREGSLAPEVAAFLDTVDADRLRGWIAETGALRCWCDSVHLEQELAEADRPAAGAERKMLLEMVSAASLPRLPPAGFTAQFDLLVEVLSTGPPSLQET